MATSSVFSGRSAMDIGQQFQSNAIGARSSMRSGSGDPGKTAGGFINAAAGGAIGAAGIGASLGETAAGAAIGGPVGLAVGAGIMGLSYLLS